MVRTAHLAARIAILPALFLPALAAQQAPALLATARYLFVVQDNWLFQFDVDTLELRHKARLDGPGTPVLPVLPAPARVAPSQMVAPEEPAAEAPSAGGRYAARSAMHGLAAQPTARAVEAGLQWLARHQDEDGKWDADGFMKHDQGGELCDGPGNPVHDVGVTGLAMLAMLGAGSNLRTGTYAENLKKAAHWLRNQQQQNGLFGANASHDFIYDHAIATYAMCEAYGLSNYQILKSTAQNAINYLESHRNPYSVWRYQPRDNDNDTSVTSWCLVACMSGKFFGLQVNENALKLGLTWLDQVTTPDGRVGYTKAGEPSSRHPGDHGTRFPVDKCEALTAAGLFCRFFLGQDPKEVPIMKVSADRILSKPPLWDTEAGTIDFYYWYYGTYAMYQMGGRYWAEWSKKLTAAVLGNQRTEGNAQGSWDPVSVWSEDGGRIYSTALMVLSLEACYRYTRLVR